MLTNIVPFDIIRSGNTDLFSYSERFTQEFTFAPHKQTICANQELQTMKKK